MKIQGVIRWFCNTSGEGIVSGIDGRDDEHGTSWMIDMSGREHELKEIQTCE